MKPWPKGVSGNPGGRPKRDLASIIAREVFAESPEAIKAGLARALQRGDAAVFKVLAERAFGRLPQPVAVTGDSGRPIRIVFAGERPPWLSAHLSQHASSGAGTATTLEDKTASPLRLLSGKSLGQRE
jgi:hypothetical protein